MSQSRNTIAKPKVTRQSKLDPKRILPFSLKFPGKTATDGYDSDVGPPKADQRLSWRLDPSISLSDWTIHVTGTRFCDDCERKDETVSYHVHKNILAVGPRKSYYFLTLFQNDDGFKESQNNTSNIVLHELASNAFPHVLDYLYSVDCSLDINTQNATALHYLAQYFQIPSMRWEAKKFWQKDLNLDNCSQYCKHALIFQDDKILKSITSICSNNIMKLTKKSKLLDASNSQLWVDILKHSSVLKETNGWLPMMTSGSAVSHHISVLIAEFCSKNRDALDQETFLKLTGIEFLPEIEVEAACKLLDVGTQVAEVVARRNELSCLQRRCISAFARAWDTPIVSDPATTALLSKQSPFFHTY